MSSTLKKLVSLIKIVGKHSHAPNTLTLLHSERPKLYAILAFLSAIGLNIHVHSGHPSPVKELGEGTFTWMHVFKEINQPGRVAQSVGHLTHKSGVLGSIPGLATYIRFSFRIFKKGSCQLLAKVCARSTG